MGHEAGRTVEGRPGAWLTWGARRSAPGNSPLGATGGPAGAAQPASEAGRLPTRSSAGSRQAPADTGNHGSLGTGSRPIWKESSEGVKAASVPSQTIFTTYPVVSVPVGAAHLPGVWPFPPWLMEHGLSLSDRPQYSLL